MRAHYWRNAHKRYTGVKIPTYNASHFLIRCWWSDGRGTKWAVNQCGSKLTASLKDARAAQPTTTRVLCTRSLFHSRWGRNRGKKNDERPWDLFMKRAPHNIYIQPTTHTHSRTPRFQSRVALYALLYGRVYLYVDITWMVRAGQLAFFTWPALNCLPN
jgi:hypothetical protein